MESLIPFLPYLLIFAGLALFAWFLLRRLDALLGAKKEDQTLLMVQQQIEQLRS